MNKSNTILQLVRLSFWLIIIGWILSLIALTMPWWNVFEPDLLSNAGTFASAVATLFGIGIAGVAIWVYLEKEDARNIQADNALLQKNKLEVSLNMITTGIFVSQKIQQDQSYTESMIKRISEEIDYTMNHARQLFSELFNSEIGIVLSNISVDDNKITAYMALNYLNQRISEYQKAHYKTPQLNNSQIIRLVILLGETLKELNDSNIKDYLIKDVNRNNLDILITQYKNKY